MQGRLLLPYLAPDALLHGELIDADASGDVLHGEALRLEERDVSVSVAS